MGVIISQPVLQVPTPPNWGDAFSVPSDEVHMVTYAHLCNTSSEVRKVRVCQVNAGTGEAGSEGNAIYWELQLEPNSAHAWGKGQFIPPGYKWVVQANAAGVTFSGSAMGIDTDEVA